MDNPFRPDVFTPPVPPMATNPRIRPRRRPGTASTRPPSPLRHLRGLPPTQQHRAPPRMRGVFYSSRWGLLASIALLFVVIL